MKNSNPISLKIKLFEFAEDFITSSKFLFIFLLSYLILIPISYFENDTFKNIWDNFILIIFLLGCFFGVIFIYNLIKENLKYHHILGVSFSLYFLLGFMIVFKFLGLQPIQSFINVIFIIILFFLSYGILLYIELFSFFKTYLARNLHFVKSCSRLLILYSFWYVVGIIISLISIIKNNPFESITTIILYTFSIIYLYYIIQHILKYLTNIIILDKRQFIIESSLALVLLFGINIASLISSNIIDNMLISIYFLFISVFYCLNFPSKRKSSPLMYLFFFLFLLYYLLGILNINLFELFNFAQSNNKQFTLQLLISFFQLLIAASMLIIAFVKIRKENIEINKDTYYNITREDANNAIDDIIENEGLNYDSLLKCMGVIIISNEFNYFKIIISNDKEIENELKICLEISILCIEYKINKKVRLYPDISEEEKKDFDDNEIDTFITESEYFIDIEDDDKFILYLKSIFPNNIKDKNNYDLYFKNEYIRNYLDINILQNVKPPSTNIIETLKYKFRTYIIILCLSVLLISQLPNELLHNISYLNPIRLIKWFNIRKNEIQMKFTNIYKPFIKDEFKSYYANQLYNWNDNFQENNKIDNKYLNEEDFKKMILCYSNILSFYNKKDYLYSLIISQLGHCYYQIKDYNNSLNCYKILLLDNNNRDFNLSMVSRCLVDMGKKIEARNYLLSIKDSLNDYISSKIELSKIFFEEKNYFGIINILKRFKLRELPYNILYIQGLSYYFTNNYDNSLKYFHEIERRDEFKKDFDIYTNTNLYLANIYYTKKEYFESSDYYYNYFNTIFNNNITIDTNIIKYFGISIESTRKRNPSDYRIDEWFKLYKKLCFNINRKDI
ncbi:MAG: hypothetical protein HW421_1063 [Ignavibacteria bacterium]|nr:hypothetical protein [Ignavibacteria bacterium]